MRFIAASDIACATAISQQLLNRNPLFVLPEPTLNSADIRRQSTNRPQNSQARDDVSNRTGSREHTPQREDKENSIDDGVPDSGFLVMDDLGHQ